MWGLSAPAVSIPKAPRQGAVATVHPLATRAASRAMDEGGNAVDAAIAAALTLGVVDGHNSGIGGGCLALVRLADGRIIAVDGRETAPEAATRDMFVRDGRAVPALSTTGALAVGVPGELAVLDWLARHHGRQPLRRHLLAAAGIAEAGFPVPASYAGRLRDEAASIGRFPATAAIFLRPDGQPWGTGEWLRQPDLARTYHLVAEQGIRWFYRGDFAKRTEAWMRANGGILTARDFRRYEIRLREPVRSTYRDCEVVGFPPPSSGGIHVAQALNLLERYPLRTMGSESADFAHVVAESLKRVFADRAHWLGDADFGKVPRGLIDRGYADRLAASIRLDRATGVAGHGNPPAAADDLFGKHTTHLSTADSEGNWVALTATINTTLGSKVVVPGTGVVLNNQMDDFSAQPGATNSFGLTGSEANAVARRKRPLSSMSPTLILRGGRPLLAVGAAGGPTIISQALLTILQVVDFDCAPEAALARPRLHHQWLPDELQLEDGWSNSVSAELEARGHRVRRVRSLGAAQAVGADASGNLDAGADPRVDGAAAVSLSGN